MSEVTRILNSIEAGHPERAEELLPLVYAELRRLAAKHLSAEAPGQTLQPTGLVHEAYLRLVDVEQAQQWDSRGHFFAAAAEAMRRILVENARRKQRIKHGGRMRQVELDKMRLAGSVPDDDILAVNEALDALEQVDQAAAQLVRLHYFAALTLEEAAKILGVSVRTAHRTWSYARAWLYRYLTANRP
jgi:RNA polymerase sigma factor (TIGR02999 family)